MTLGSGLIGALQFLTRVPIRMSGPVPHHRVVPWFPVAGAIIGVVVGGVAAMSVLIVDPMLAAALAVAAGMLVTGAFHEDGLADIADAFGGGWTVEQRMEIMKDSRHGTYAVATMTSSILIRVVALSGVAVAADPAAAMFVAAVVAHSVARAAAVGAMLVFPPAVDAGLGAGAASELRLVPTAIGLCFAAAGSAALIGTLVLPVMAAAALAVSAVGLLAKRKIGGITGDVLGATEQVGECAVLVVLAAGAAAGSL